MLPKTFRLKKKYEFNYIYRKGKSSHTKELTLFYSRNKNSHKKVGFSVSKKYGNAVERNRIKRVLREVLRSLLPLMKNEFNYILIVKSELKDKQFKEIFSIVRNMLDKNDLIKL